MIENPPIPFISNANGELTLKEVYCFKNQNSQTLDWAKDIWIKDIPTSKSFLVWRIMHPFSL